MEQKQMGITLGVSSILGTRKNQQDTVFGQVDGDQALAVVCDGMGGLNGGEIASQTAVRTLVEDHYRNPDVSDIPIFFRDEAFKMNEAVRELKDDRERPLDGGTTCVAAFVRGNALYWFAVGDSRIYLIRGNEIAAVNPEHNLRYKLDADLAAGKITKEEYKREEESQGEALISYLGIDELKLMEINAKPFLLKERDIILLCSDGLYRSLPEQEIVALIHSDEPDMVAAARRLTGAVQSKGKWVQDNASIIVMQYA